MGFRHRLIAFGFIGGRIFFHTTWLARQGCDMYAVVIAKSDESVF